MSGCLIFILFVVLLCFGPVGWICAAVLGIILLTQNKKTKCKGQNENSKRVKRGKTAIMQ